MPRKSPPKPDEKPQFERFIEAAEQIDAASTDEGLDKVVQRIAHAKLPKHVKTSSKRR
jgi:hypothetical protein